MTMKRFSRQSLITFRFKKVDHEQTTKLCLFSVHQCFKTKVLSFYLVSKTAWTFSDSFFFPLFSHSIQTNSQQTCLCRAHLNVNTISMCFMLTKRLLNCIHDYICIDTKAFKMSSPSPFRWFVRTFTAKCETKQIQHFKTTFRRQRNADENQQIQPKAKQRQTATKEKHFLLE